MNSLIKLPFCRFLLIQYKNKWLVRIRLCRLGGNKTLPLRLSPGFLVNTKCKAIFAVASFRNSSAQFYNPAWCSNFSKLSDGLVNV